ncbi:RNA-directed DNA polymerase, eukaryota, reverse transcriptase zinc-binding domain protein [Tanacetum coccineum]
MINVPMEAWSVKGISALSSSIGKPIIMHEFTTKMSVTSVGRIGFARVLVEIDAEKGIKDKIEIMYKSKTFTEGTKKIVDVEYSWLPCICSHYKVFSHTDSYCRIKKNVTEQRREGFNMSRRTNMQNGQFEYRRRREDEGKKKDVNRNKEMGMEANVININNEKDSRGELIPNIDQRKIVDEFLTQEIEENEDIIDENYGVENVVLRNKVEGIDSYCKIKKNVTDEGSTKVQENEFKVVQNRKQGREGFNMSRRTNIHNGRYDRRWNEGRHVNVNNKWQQNSRFEYRRRKEDEGKKKDVNRNKGVGMEANVINTNNEKDVNRNKGIVWVKRINVPMKALSVKGISALASSIGKHVIMDEVTTKMCVTSVGRIGFARVLVEIDPEKGIKDKIEIMYKSKTFAEGTKKTMDVEYSWLPCEACHLDEQNPRCLEDWENLDFQDLVVDGECFQVEVHCCGGEEVVKEFSHMVAPHLRM